MELKTRSKRGLEERTSVCTMEGRCERRMLTVWNMSTTPSNLIRSSTILSAMNTPDLPAPLLHHNITIYR